MSREFARKFTSSGYFTMEKCITKQPDIDASLDSGSVEFVLVIEKNFEKKIKKGETAQVLTLIDGTDSNRAGIIVSYINQITMDYSQKLLRGKVAAVVTGRGLTFSPRAREIAVEERTLFNQELASRNFFLPGVLVLLLGLVTVLLTAMSVVKEREVGTIEQIVVSPAITPSKPGE